MPSTAKRSHQKINALIKLNRWYFFLPDFDAKLIPPQTGPCFNEPVRNRQTGKLILDIGLNKKTPLKMVCGEFRIARKYNFSKSKKSKSLIFRTDEWVSKTSKKKQVCSYNRYFKIHNNYNDTFKHNQSIFKVIFLNKNDVPLKCMKVI